MRRHPSNRGERKAARQKSRLRGESKERYDSGRKAQERGPDFIPADLNRKAAKSKGKMWQTLAALLPSGAEELTPNELYFGGVAAGGDKYIKF